MNSKQKEYSNYGFSGDYVILMEKQNFVRTESGKSWKSKPEKVVREVLTPTQYNNFLSFVPVWNDRVEKSCTMAGYHPVRVTSTCPDGSKKSVARFEFLYKPDMIENAGWLEKVLIEEATTYETETHSRRFVNKNGYEVCEYRRYITLINPDETGVKHSATYEEYTHTWH